MKKFENTFAVTGFVGKDAKIRNFTNASVAHFSLAIGRQEKNGEETKRKSAFINVEAWRKNENVESFSQLTKGTLLTIEGYFKPEEWADKDGVLHNNIVMVATKFYPAVEQEGAPRGSGQKIEKRQKIVPVFSWTKRLESRFCFARSVLAS